MAAEYLFGIVVLLLPLAAVSGWYFGRREISPDAARNGVSGISSDYFRGLNYLLDDRPDKAIEVFIKVLEVESETVETHLALGNLFRHRGEVDRAIRIHQNLVSKPSLDFDQRALHVRMAQSSTLGSTLRRASVWSTRCVPTMLARISFCSCAAAVSRSFCS